MLKGISGVTIPALGRSLGDSDPKADLAQSDFACEYERVRAQGLQAGVQTMGLFTVAAMHAYSCTTWVVSNMLGSKHLRAEPLLFPLHNTIFLFRGIGLFLATSRFLT